MNAQKLVSSLEDRYRNSGPYSTQRKRILARIHMLAADENLTPVARSYASAFVAWRSAIEAGDAAGEAWARAKEAAEEEAQP